MNGMHWTALATLGVLALNFATIALVGRARGKYGIKAPATTGHELFDRAYRVQMNTLESTVLFLPALWLSAIYMGALASTALAAVWLAARAWYAIAYTRDPKTRGPAFVSAFLAWAAMMLGTSWGVIAQLLGR